MKTKLLTLALITVGILAINSASAANCNGGERVTAGNGHEYCRSDSSSMNWWSAYAWCEAQGRHLATIYELCPDWDGSMGTNKCSNYVSSFYGAWSSTPYQTNEAILVYGSSPKSVGTQERTVLLWALCY